MGDATLAAAGRELDLLRSFADRDPASSFAFRHVDHGHADVAVCAMRTGGTVGTSQYPLPWRITYRLRRSPQSRAVSSRAMEPQSRPPTTMLPLTPQAPANALDRLLRALERARILHMRTWERIQPCRLTKKATNGTVRYSPKKI